MHWNLHPATAFSAHRSAWDEVNAAMGGMPFLESALIALLLDAFGTGRERLAVCSEQGRTVAIALVAPRGRGVWETFQPSQLPLGAWVMRPDTAWQGVLASLVRALPGLALGVGITQQDPALLRRPEPNGTLHTLDYVQTAWIEVTGTFDAYWSGRGKNLRHNMRKQRQKLAEEGVDTRLDVLTDPADVADAVRDYGELESAGWKAESGTAITADNAQGRFYTAMLADFCRRSAGRIYRYCFGGKTVAMDLCIEGNGTLVILKTAYDEQQKRFSPASLLHQDAFQGIFAEGRIRRIEFYGKVMEWHTRWTENTRMLYHANYYRWPWLPGVRRLASPLLGARSVRG
jgi:CelD/BcsL family acetyltransferase involved in cellulose biosynthesis